jgi:hypothetical protein
MASVNIENTQQARISIGREIARDVPMPGDERIGWKRWSYLLMPQQR